MYEPLPRPTVEGMPASIDRPTRLRLRPVTPDDEPLLRELLGHVTGDSRWSRFFTGGVDLDRVARMEARCDDPRRIGVLALGPDDEVLGHGMCVPLDDETSCEIAFEVADGHHRQGIGTAMLFDLVARAREAGVRQLVAEVLPGNRDMIDLLRDSGLPIEQRLEDGVSHYEVALGSPAVNGPSAPGNAT